MKTAHTYKELREIAGDWTTVGIINDYTRGSDHFQITYNGETVLYQNDDLFNVANCASQYNGFGWKELMKFGFSMT